MTTENEDDPNVWTIRLKKRSPAETRAWYDGYGAGLNAVADALAKALESYHSARAVFETLSSQASNEE
jgi:hypothetical protein